MRIEVHYDNGDVIRYEGNNALIYVIRAEGHEQRVTLGVGGKLDALSICYLLTLLDLQLQEDTEILDIALELWREHRARLAAEAMMCKEGEADAQDTRSDGGDVR